VRYLGLPDDPGHALAAQQMTAFGAIVSLELVGGAEAAEAVAAGTRLWLHATSLGGVESTLERRRRWAEESPDVPEGLLRLSVGIEDMADLWADLSAQLDRLAGPPGG
jgi:cystathionine gamma-synthase